ncbi:MAG TPA: SET domain-containing protein [Gammaproteobacteria bacterium]|nr:SET domain-containing protein [Gammaproteobacteria bacterium]
MKYHFLPPCFVVKNGIHGIGIFTTKNIKKGSVLFEMQGDILNHPTRTSVQIGKMIHIEDDIARRINHNCKPTAKVDRKTRSFISLQDIKKGEEITFNYNDNEDVLACPFVCACCYKKIAGRKFLLKNPEFGVI